MIIIVVFTQESDVIFGVIEDVLSVSADQLERGQLDFNTSGR